MSESTALAQVKSLAPTTLKEAMEFAEFLAQSDVIPKDFKGKPANVLVAIQWGMELGLAPMQALQNIAVINGRPSIWGDALLALVQASPLCVYVKESDDGNKATCRVLRRGEHEEEYVVTFGMEDAKTAKLLGKEGPWQTSPKRMRQMRARAFALRDKFADVLRGMPVAEELMDYPPEKFMGPAEVVTGSDNEARTLTYPEADFEQAFPGWEKLIVKGKKTAADITKVAETLAPLSEAQKARLGAVKVAVDATQAQAGTGGAQ